MFCYLLKFASKFGLVFDLLVTVNLMFYSETLGHKEALSIIVMRTMSKLAQQYLLYRSHVNRDVL